MHFLLYAPRVIPAFLFLLAFVKPAVANQTFNQHTDLHVVRCHISEEIILIFS